MYRATRPRWLLPFWQKEGGRPDNLSGSLLPTRDTGHASDHTLVPPLVSIHHICARFTPWNLSISYSLAEGRCCQLDETLGTMLTKGGLQGIINNSLLFVAGLTLVGLAIKRFYGIPARPGSTRAETTNARQTMTSLAASHSFITAVGRTTSTQTLLTWNGTLLAV